ncbi:MAG TPA: PTS sugar transporter subunit IIA, partial [Bacteroidota bacterium]|nr:PTS sugar transporter subunit IIA [Bacteroidota bacterium]
NPIDYQSLDHEPVRLLFLLIGKDSLVGAHIKLLSRISRLMNKEELRGKLLQSTSAEQILNILKEEEMNYLDV